jgi:hypothetical protein
MKYWLACARGLEYLLVDELKRSAPTRAAAGVAGVSAEAIPGSPIAP